MKRLLGVIVNNTMTWEHHLYGNEDHRGLVPKLTQRAGVIRKLSFIISEDRLKAIAEGIFFSLLNYCTEIFGNVAGTCEQNITLSHRNGPGHTNLSTCRKDRSALSSPEDSYVHSRFCAQDNANIGTTLKLLNISPQPTSTSSWQTPRKLC